MINTEDELKYCNAVIIAIGTIKSQTQLANPIKDVTVDFSKIQEYIK